MLDLVIWHEAEHRLATTALALERRRADHGRYPSHLEDLVPKYLANVPVSPFDGRPIRHRVRADGRVLLAAPQQGNFAQPSSDHDALWLAPKMDGAKENGTGNGENELFPLIQFDSAPLGDVIAVLTGQSGMSVSPAPGVTYGGRGPVTFRFYNVTPRRVLEAVLRWNGLKLTQDRFTGCYWVVDGP